MNVSLGPSGTLLLQCPSGRTLELTIGPHTGLHIERLLRDAKSDGPPQRGYIGKYPTQAEVNRWRELKLQSNMDDLMAEYELDLKELDFSL